jgi:transposase
MDAQVSVVAEDVQVAAKPQRRTYTAEYKRRILKEADACTTPGALGALLRREGLYSSHLVTWRRARARGELAWKIHERAHSVGRGGRRAGTRARSGPG